MEQQYILAIDQGTTSNRAALFSCATGKIALMKSKEFTQHFPQDGWVEHDGEEIWQGAISVGKQVLQEAANLPHFSLSHVAALGITNQRETVVVWEKLSGKLVYPAIVWQDRRTADYCKQLKQDGVEDEVKKKTGLPIDPYFCSTKIHWILNHVSGARQRAQRGELAFGTIDTYLIWRLTGGKHFTDVTNASRTNLYNINTHNWDDELLRIFDIPRSMFGEVKPCNANFGMVEEKHFGIALPICGVAGDQQSSLFGQACFSKGMMKSTYGTGAFLLINTGEKRVFSSHKLLTTVGYQLHRSKIYYALEGAIFIAGAALKWLHENLEIFNSYAATEKMAASLAGNENLYIVPAFSGLGAPYWDPYARGAVFGITRNTSKATIVRATLEAMAYQTHDIFTALKKDGVQPTHLKVDGGLTQNAWLLQFMANILDTDIHMPENHETTVMGACFLAALGAGIYADENEVGEKYRLSQKYTPSQNFLNREQLLEQWQNAVSCVRMFAEKNQNKANL